jgi:tRNA(Ile)-lysidine synthase
MKLLDKINKTIRKYSMLSEGDSVLIGLSGGPDSVCLTIILDKLRDNFNLSLYAVYINHGLRPDEVVQEISSCRSLCDRLGIRFIPKSINLEEYVRENNLNLQKASRELRSACLKKCPKN